MPKVLVVCGAGASSTFLVHWMRREAESRGLRLEIDAGSQNDLAGRLPELAAVLVGSHLAANFSQLRTESAAAGVPAALLPTLAFDAAGASIALDLLEELLAASVESAASADDQVAPGGAHDAGSPRG